MKPSFIAPAIGFILLAGCASQKGVHHPGLSPDGYGYVKNGPTLPPPNGLVTHMSNQESQALKNPASVHASYTQAPVVPSPTAESAKTHNRTPAPPKPGAAPSMTSHPVITRVPTPRKKPTPVKPAPVIDDNILPDGGVLSATPVRVTRQKRRHK